MCLLPFQTKPGTTINSSSALEKIKMLSQVSVSLNNGTLWG
jgi:hypothetical protein